MDNKEGEEAPPQTFVELHQQIEEKIDEIIFKTFKARSYDPKDAQKWCNDMSEVIIKML